MTPHRVFGWLAIVVITLCVVFFAEIVLFVAGIVFLMYVILWATVCLEDNTWYDPRWWK